MQYKVGSKVLLKSWEQLVEEFGPVDEDGDLDLPRSWVCKEMVGLLNSIVTVEEIDNDEDFTVGEDTPFDNLKWYFSNDMIQEVVSE